MVIVERWTQEQQDGYKGEFPGAQPKPWVVKDGEIVYSFYDSEEGAVGAATVINRDDKIAEQFQEWVDQVAKEFGVSTILVEDIVKGQL